MHTYIVYVYVYNMYYVRACGCEYMCLWILNYLSMYMYIHIHPMYALRYFLGLYVCMYVCTYVSMSIHLHVHALIPHMHPFLHFFETDGSCAFSISSDKVLRAGCSW